MHGRKRAEYKAKLRDPKVSAALSQKALQWHALMQELSQRRGRSEDGNSNNSSSNSTSTLALLEKALLVNPDPLNLWNHRREVFLLLHDNDERSNGLLDAELALTRAALERNPKAYGAWCHRKWSLKEIQPAPEVLQQELQLTAQFLKLDERNFHCWNYRRFVVACLAGNWNGVWPGMEPPTGSVTMMGPQLASRTGSQRCEESPTAIPPELLQGEWEFTQSKIQDNFSNFSAFHYRYQLLPYKLRTESVPTVLEAEFSLVEDAFCTEPDDQTAWWYHAMLLDTYGKDSSLQERLESQVELLQELLEDSPGKWVLLGLHKLLQVLQKSVAEQQVVLDQLMELDPDRKHRYQELAQQLST